MLSQSWNPIPTEKKMRKEGLIIPKECEPWILKHRTSLKDYREYADAILREYEQMKPYLPEKCNSITDIGCGMAGIDVFLKRHYPDAKLMLYDKDGKSKITNGWFGGDNYYTSRECADALLKENGVTDYSWHDTPHCADLVISLFSWGFHYPLATYDVHGLCIADIRKRREIVKGTIISEDTKRARCMWVQ